MEGSSAATLELELAKFARSHIQGIPTDAKQEQLVQAALQFMAEYAGSILLVIDDVVLPPGVPMTEVRLLFRRQVF